MRKIFNLFAIFLLFFWVHIAAQTNFTICKNLNAPIEKHVADQLSRMTIEEKAAQLRTYLDGKANKVADATVNIEGFKKVYDSSEVEKMAKKYFRNDLVYRGFLLKDGEDKAYFNNTEKPIAKSVSNEASQAICFFDDLLSLYNIRGKQYFEVEFEKDYLKISHSFDGKPIFRSHINVFQNNQILGARMASFFQAEYSKKSTIIGNTVNGTNGSGVMNIQNITINRNLTKMKC